MEARQRIVKDTLPLFRELYTSSEHPHENVRDVVQGHKPQKTTSFPESKDGYDLDVKSTSTSTSTFWYQTLSRKALWKQRRDTFDPEQVLPRVESEKELKPARNPPETSIYDYIPLFRFFKWLILIIFRRTASLARMADERQKTGRDALGRKRRMGKVESNVPMEICLYLSRWALSLSHIDASDSFFSFSYIACEHGPV